VRKGDGAERGVTDWGEVNIGSGVFGELMRVVESEAMMKLCGCCASTSGFP